VTESFVILEVTTTFFEGGISHKYFQFLLTVTFLVQTYIVSIVSMKCLHKATSAVSVCSLAKEFGGLCLPWSF